MVNNCKVIKQCRGIEFDNRTNIQCSMNSREKILNLVRLTRDVHILLVLIVKGATGAQHYLIFIRRCCCCGSDFQM